MNPAVKLMSRSRWSWRAWMALGTPVLLLSFVLNLLIDCALHVYRQWHWDWKYEFREWFEKFGERHRKSLHSLGLKPEPGGVLVTKEMMAEPGVWMYDDLGPGREFTIRAAEDVQ